MKRTAPKKRPSRKTSCLHDLGTFLRHALDVADAIEWPLVKYARDPVGFVREVLHEEPLPHQITILNAVRDHDKVCVRSGQKIGKTKLLAWVGLWGYACFEDAKVYMTASTGDQVGRVPYEEVKKTIRHARKFGLKIEDPAANPGGGIQAEDGRKFIGFTTRDIEAMAGLSGLNQFYLVDEASALKPAMAEAIEGNTAGGGKIFYISNPTRTEGPFFDAFHSRKAFWDAHHISSEDIARSFAESGAAPVGIATLAKIEVWEEEYRRDSPFFIVRVLGEFLKNEAGKVLNLDEITQAELRYDENAPAEGPLYLGYDPAGEGDGGDEHAFCLRRGKKIVGLFAERGLSKTKAVERVRELLASYRHGDEIPSVIVDAEGDLGSEIFYALRSISEILLRTHPDKAFRVYAMRSSKKARRKPNAYERQRDELWMNLALWIRDGGAIPRDFKLSAELNAPSWQQAESGLLYATSKKRLREMLGRSPDRADALCLAVWEPTIWDGAEEGTGVGEAEEGKAAVVLHAPSTGGGSVDPYGGSGGERGGAGGIDPYR